MVCIEFIRLVNLYDASNQWEAIFISNDYELVFYDGLSRIYLSREYRDLRKKLFVPPEMAYPNFINK